MNGPRRHWRLLGTLLVGGAWAGGCAAPYPEGGGPAGAPTAGDAGEATPAARATQGSLRQEEITIELRSGVVQVRLTPLDSGIVRLTAPDTRRRLESLTSLAAGDGVAFLVSVFTEEPGGAPFEPGSVSLENRGRVFRPVRVRALTTGWGTRLAQQRAEQAVYLFSPEVDLEMPLVVEVAGARSGAWSSILPRIDAERARVRARSGGQPSRPNFRIFR
ncbi:MAG: hypothetical protein JSU98_09180 [Gemmatimonadales bacterium]|jgi:hypothetical protein|nr:MAG: hypothetical protein JSU98_09180 [Gemmatimonadales bacterium]